MGDFMQHFIDSTMYYLGDSHQLYGKKFELFDAAQDGDVDTINELMENKSIHVDATDDDGNTALFVAIEDGNIEVIKVLLKHGADINIIANDQTPLLFAIYEGKPEVVKLLLSRGAKVEEGESALQHAYKSGRQEIVQVLMEQGANAEEVDCEGTSAFQAAIRGGNVSLVKSLLGKYDIEKKDEYGKTALFYAKHPGIVELLLDHGARIDVKVTQDAWNRNVAHHAIQECWAEAAKVLLEHGTAVDNVDFFGETILDSAVYSVKYCSDRESVEDNPYLVVVRHLVKNSLISKRHSKTINQNKELSKYKVKCEKELEAMKKKVILKGTNETTFHRFLMTKDVNELAALARNEKFITAIKSAQAEFPIYFSLLTYQLRKGMWRNMLLGKVKYFFSALADTKENKGLPILPKICVDKIYSYFNSNDFRALIRVCDPLNYFDAEICDIQIN